MSRSLGDWLRRLERLHPHSIELGLERCGRVHKRLGRPVLAERIWSVAGTNGKGSVTAFLSAMAASAGLSAGCYTSPHILRFNERIRIDGVDVEDAEIVDALRRVEEARGEISLTFFEFTTLAAFTLFAERDLDAVVLEVGLGGRLDAVNLVDAHCSVITPIGLDHIEYLGPDRERIALEKAGIIRAGRPVVIGDRNPPQSLRDKVNTISAIPCYLGEDFDIGDTENGRRYLGRNAIDLPARLPLPGAHQWDNLAVALTAFTALMDLGELDSDWLSRALAAVRLSGRLQAWPGDERIILNVGHNPMAARAAAGFLRGYPASETICVLGMLSDKDVGRAVQALSPQSARWYCAGLDGDRAQAGDELAERVRAQVPAASVRDFRSVSEALAAARTMAGNEARILVFGSFHTVEDAIHCLQSAEAGRDQC